MNIRQIILWLTLLWTYSLSAFALPEYTLNQHALNQSVNQFAYLDATKRTQLTPAKLSQGMALDHSNWQLSDHESLPVVDKGHNWLAFRVSNLHPQDAMYYLSIHSSIKALGQQVYIRSDNQAYQRLTQTSYQANVYVTELPLAANSRADILVYVDAQTEHQLPIKVFSGDAFIDDITDAQFGYGIAIGGVLALAITLIFLYVANKNKMTLLLAGYFIAKALLLSVLLGINLHLLFPNNAQIKGLELPVLTAAAQVCLLWFVINLFQLKSALPMMAKIIRNYCWVLLVYMPVSVQLPLMTNLVLSMTINMVTAVMLLVLGIQLLKLEHRLARLFIGVIALQLVFYFIDLSLGHGVINIYGDNLVLYCISFWANAFFITFLLSREHYFQVQEQQATQAQALEHALSSEKAQAELLALQQSSQELLEEKVQERTLELNIALQELESANRELEEKNTRDELTGLYNRRFYDQKIMAEYRRSRRNLTPLSLMVVDIDHFKKVNDTHGHLAGDQCIASIAEAFKHCLRRSSDMACRYGGEEFCIILPETETSGAVILAEEIRNYVGNHPVSHADITIPLTVSIGVSTYKQQVEVGTDELFAAADQALYVAKEQGRNQVQQYPINNEQNESAS